MSTIFNSTLLNQQPARYTVIAEAVLPGLLLLIFGSMYNRIFLGQTPSNPTIAQTSPSAFKNNTAPEMFAIVWFLLVAAWTIALVVAAMNFDTTPLCLVGAFSFVALFVCVYWAYLYQTPKRRGEAARILVLADFVMWAAVISAASCSATEDAKLTVAVLLSPVAVWLTVSTLLGFHDLEKQEEDDL